MSEYQRYEFMTVDRPLTKMEQEAVDALSSHIEVSATHALVEYNWGDFKHDPIDVLHKYFDGFLYWANWGSPQLAFRFPRGILPGNLLAGYDLEDFASFTRYKDCDILNIEFGEMEGPDVWTEYDLGSLIPIREELMEGDLRALYIVWLAAQEMMGSYDEEEEYEIDAPPVPPGMDDLTGAQEELAALFQVSEELLAAAAEHSATRKASREATDEDIAASIKLLPPERSNEYLLRLAQNEPGLSRLFLRELRDLGRDKTGETSPAGERVTYATLLAESKNIRARLEREKREQAEAERRRHLQDIDEHRDRYWQEADQAASRGTSSGYDEATRLLIELREAANYFNESQAFQAHFRAWIGPHTRRPALIKRLQAQNFTIPGV
jgi:hypothetical protein